MARRPRRTSRPAARRSYAAAPRRATRSSYRGRASSRARSTGTGRTVRIVIEQPQMSALARPGFVSLGNPAESGQERRLMRTLNIKKAAF